MSKLTQEEEYLAESFIFLEMARKVLEKDLKRLDHTPLKIKEPYSRLIEIALEQVSKELYSIKQSLKEQKIKVQFQYHDEMFSEYIVFYRGYVLTMKFLNNHLKHQVSKKIETIFLKEDHRSSSSSPF